MPSPPQSPTVSCAAIVLAAGMSRRMGESKALLDLGGQPLIRRLVNTLRNTRSIRHIAVVTGHQPRQIHHALAGHAVEFVQNPHFEHGGMLSSIQTGVAALPPAHDAFFIALLDQPLVRAETLDALALHHAAHEKPITLPAFRGKRGHPVLIAAHRAPEILSLPPEATLRDFVAQHEKNRNVIEVDDPGVLSDVDTPADYQKLVDQWRTLTCPAVTSEPA